MNKKTDQHVFQGMQRDLSVSKQQPQFLWEAHNIRLTAREGDTLTSVTNEKGTEELTFNVGELGKDDNGCSQEQIVGTYVGHCVIGNYLTVFTHATEGDYIFRICKEEDGSFSLSCLTGTETQEEAAANGTVSYKKSYKPLQLNLSEDYPLQTLGVYENENIQKVYWTDGINQPRMINITKDSLYDNVSYTEDSFDFVPRMTLNDSIHIVKKTDSSSSFGAGVIQYAVTYYNKYGQETNISCVSELIPTSFTDRAGSPEEKIGNSFEVTVKNPDTAFEYLRLYSIFRSSLNGTAACKRVTDVDLSTATNSYRLNIGSVWQTQEMVVQESFQIMTSLSEGYKDFDPSDWEALLQDVILEDGSMENCYVFDAQLYPDLVLKVTDERGVERYIRHGYSELLYISQIYSDQAGDLRNVWGYKYEARLPAAFEYSDSITVERVMSKVLIIDNGTIGDDIDSEELLYVGGESITAETLEQKDGTLFLGNIKVIRPTVSETIKNALVDNVRGGYSDSWCSTVKYDMKNVLTGTYVWGSQLNATLDGYAANTAGFKHGEHYRLGIQFQYNTGKWSEPLFLKDVTQEETPKYNSSAAELTMPTFSVELSSSIKEKLRDHGYVRVRGMVVMPSASDKLIVAQGVLNPTVYSVGLAENHAPDLQSSWFFRPWHELNDLGDTVTDSYVSNGNNDFVSNGAFVQCQHGRTLYGAGRGGCGFIGTSGVSRIPVSYSRGAEIQGVPPDLTDVEAASIPDKMTLWVDDGSNYDDDDREVTKDTLNSTFAVSQQYLTMHSPEFEFDTSFSSLDTVSLQLRRVGRANFLNTVGYIDIEETTPPISSDSNGFFKKTISTKTNVKDTSVYLPSAGNSQFSARRLCAGLFYRDSIVDDIDSTTFEPVNKTLGGITKQEYSFMVYPWHRTGSLNNDCNRPSGGGTRSAELKRKIISNLSFTDTEYFDADELPLVHNNNRIQCYLQENSTLLKINGKNYYADVDELLVPSVPYGYAASSKSEDFTSDIDCCSASYSWRADTQKTDSIGNEYKGLRLTSEGVRMKYKSTSHALVALDEQCELGEPKTVISDYDGTPLLYVAELYRTANEETDFGGNTEQAYQSNLWLPAGPAVRLDDDSQDGIVVYRWGDTWFQRYDCLKTYAYTDEDTNSVVEIGSFMLETHINIDGRYDRNRGQDDNLSMSPENFNQINTVYSQLNNYFNYRILDSDYYKLSKFPSMLTWSEAKNNASDVDAWTTVTLASTLELDGTNGEVTALVTDRDRLYAFQEKGLSQVLFNSRVAISTSDNVPIEISNNYKVDGNKYISTSVGCYNKFAIAKSPSGVYFIDGIGNVLYRLNEGQLNGVSDVSGFNYWFSQQETQIRWKPGVYYPTVRAVSANPYSTYTDGFEIAQSISPVRKAQADKMTGYSSIYNVQGWLNSKGLALYYDFNKKDLYVLTPKEALCYSELLKQFISFMDYEGGILFNIGTTFHALTNKEKTGMNFWKMFSGKYNSFFYDRHKTDITFISNAESTADKIFTNLELRADFYNEEKKLQHSRFFDTVRVTDEYQDTGDTKLVYKAYPYNQGGVVSNTKKKFRIWRCDIPRALKNGRRSMDRIRNTWCKVCLTMNRHLEDGSNAEGAYSMELHDVGVVYYV